MRLEHLGDITPLAKNKNAKKRKLKPLFQKGKSQKSQTTRKANLTMFVRFV